jgi:hypothetical protein
MQGATRLVRQVLPVMIKLIASLDSNEVIEEIEGTEDLYAEGGESGWRTLTLPL